MRCGPAVDKLAGRERDLGPDRKLPAAVLPNADAGHVEHQLIGSKQCVCLLAQQHFHGNAAQETLQAPRCESWTCGVYRLHISWYWLRHCGAACDSGTDLSSPSNSSLCLHKADLGHLLLI